MTLVWTSLCNDILAASFDREMTLLLLHLPLVILFLACTVLTLLLHNIIYLYVYRSCVVYNNSVMYMPSLNYIIILRSPNEMFVRSYIVLACFLQAKF